MVKYCGIYNRLNKIFRRMDNCIFTFITSLGTKNKFSNRKGIETTKFPQDPLSIFSAGFPLIGELVASELSQKQCAN